MSIKIKSLFLFFLLIGMTGESSFGQRINVHLYANIYNNTETEIQFPENFFVYVYRIVNYSGEIDDGTMLNSQTVTSDEPYFYAGGDFYNTNDGKVFHIFQSSQMYKFTRIFLVGPSGIGGRFLDTELNPSYEISGFNISESDWNNSFVNLDEIDCIIYLEPIGPFTISAEVDQYSYGYGHQVTGGGSHQPGTVTLSAIPSGREYVFAYWTGLPEDPSIFSEEAKYTNPLSFPAYRNMEIKAFFTNQNLYTVIIYNDNPGMGEVQGSGPGALFSNGSGSYVAGESVTLLAVPNEHYECAGWRGSFSSNENPLVFVVPQGGVSLTASFRPKPVLNVDVANGQGGGVTGEGEYFTGNTVTLAATPDEGFVFCAWTWDDGQGASISNPLTFTASENQHYTAHFLKAGANINCDFSGSSSKPFEVWNTPVTLATSFPLSGSYEGLDPLLPTRASGGQLTTDDLNGVRFVYNQTGGTALLIPDTAQQDLILQGPYVSWGNRFILESRVKRSGENFQGLSIISDNLLGTRVHWYLDAMQKLHLVLNEGDAAGELHAVSTESVFPVDVWTNVQVVVDLSQTTLDGCVQLYANGAPLTIDEAASSCTGAFTNGTVTLLPTATEFLARTGAYALECDFVRIILDPDLAEFTADDFYAGEVFGELSPDSSLAILIHPPSLLKRVCNAPSDFVSGLPKSAATSIVYDNFPAEKNVFHGIFEINYALDINAFKGALTVDILIKKPEDADFKKIGEMNLSGNEATDGVWMQRYYWNSRVASFDWTNDDAQAYRTEQPISFRFVVH